MTSLVRVVDDPPAEPARGWIALMAPAAELARTIAPTEFVPRGLRNNPAAIAAAILYGDEVGLGPMQSLAKIAVIDGRPTLTAEAQRALVYAAGHELWLEELTATRATWAGRRHGSDQSTRVTWTLDDARRANLAGKQNWRNYPRAMLSARASAELVRAMFADVVGGLAAVEEIDDLDAVAADPVAATPGKVRRRGRKAGGVAAIPAPSRSTSDVALPPLPGDVDYVDPADTRTVPPVQAAVEPGPLMLTDSQRRQMHARFRALGIGERAERLRYTSLVLGRYVASAKELTAAEGDALLTTLEQDRTAETSDEDDPAGEPDDDPERDDEPDDTLDGGGDGAA